MTAAARDASRSRVWVITTTGGEAVRGYLPDWAEEDPSWNGVPPDRLHVALADITHEAGLGGLVLPVTRGQGRAEESAVLAVTIGCKPFGEDGEPSIPVASVQIVGDFWLTGLDPDGAAEFGRCLRTLGDLLVTRVRPALAAARADWDRHHPGSGPLLG